MTSHDDGAMDQLSAHLDRAWDLVARGDHRGALVSAHKGLELDESSPEAHNLIGYIHAAEGDAEQALEHYRQAIEADETFIEAMLNAAELLLHPLHDYDNALQMLEDALDFCETSDELADALLLKTDVLLHAGQKEQAKQTARQLPSGPFDNPRLRLLVGRARYEIGDTDEAEQILRAAAKEIPDDADGHYYLGLVLDTQGHAEEATMAFARTRELDARSPLALWSVAADQFERHVQQAIGRLPRALTTKLEGTLIVAADLPGAEIVVDGIDPRASVLVDEGDRSEPGVRRIFVYQRNIERMMTDVADLETEIATALQHELETLFPEASTPPEGGAG